MYRPRLSEEEYRLILAHREAQDRETYINSSNLRQGGKGRLFVDIETSYYIVEERVWSLRVNRKFIDPKDIKQEKQIICVSYKWEGENDVHNLDWRMGEKEMLEAFIPLMDEASEIVAHNGNRFDEPFIRTRAFFYRIPMQPKYKSLDTLTKTRSHFLHASNKLDYLSRFSGNDGKLEHEGFEMWRKVVEDKDEEALEKMIEYCNRDVIELEDYFVAIRPYIFGETNMAALYGGEKYECQECGSDNVQLKGTRSTAMGTIQRVMVCNHCGTHYKISNKSYHTFIDDLSKKH